MADVFNEDQVKRLFGAISIGGTLGAVVGAAVTESLTTGSQGVMLEPSSLLIITLVSLELAVMCMLGVANLFNLTNTGSSPREPGPRLAKGLRLIAGSRYLQLICVYILLVTITSTFLYLTQGQIVEKSFDGTAARTAAFARILAV